MFLRRAAVVLVLALFLLPGIAQAKAQLVHSADVPREFKGQFKWRDGKITYSLVLKIDRIEEKGRIVRFFGSHLYTPGDYKMSVEGTIDSKTYRISIREFDPSRPDSETDGSFEGKISTDFQRIEAVWTTRTTGKKGDLKVEAEKEK